MNHEPAPWQVGDKVWIRMPGQLIGWGWVGRISQIVDGQIVMRNPRECSVNIRSGEAEIWMDFTQAVTWKSFGIAHCASIEPYRGAMRWLDADVSAVGK